MLTQRVEVEIKKSQAKKVKSSLVKESQPSQEEGKSGGKSGKSLPQKKPKEEQNEEEKGGKGKRRGGKSGGKMGGQKGGNEPPSEEKVDFLSEDKIADVIIDFYPEFKDIGDGTVDFFVFYSHPYPLIFTF